MAEVPRYIKDMPLARKASEDAQRKRQMEQAMSDTNPFPRETAAAATLLSIGREIGFGRAQQILGQQWDAEYGCAPRGRMGVTVKDAPKALKPLTRSQIAAAAREAHIEFCLAKQPSYDEALTRAIEAAHGIVASPAKEGSTP